jgi:hypothetical protein
MNFRARSLLIVSVAALAVAALEASPAYAALIAAPDSASSPAASDVPPGAASSESSADAEQEPIADHATASSISPALVKSPRNKISGAGVNDVDLKSHVMRATPGWLRAYATSALPADLRLAIPDYYETLLESDMRDAIDEALAANSIDVVDDPEDAPFRLRYSAEVKSPKSTSLRKSRFSIAPDVDQRYNQGVNNQYTEGSGLRPGISLGPAYKSKARGPSLRISIMVLNGDERVWSGFAEAELGEFSRSELVQIIVNALMRHWGENVEIDSAHFSASPMFASPLN